MWSGVDGSLHGHLERVNGAFFDDFGVFFFCIFWFIIFGLVYCFLTIYKHVFSISICFASFLFFY